MGIPNIDKEKFISKVAELGYTILQERDNTFSLNLNEVNSREIKIRLIISEPVIERIHGSHNGNKIQAIGYFKLKLPKKFNEPNIYIFAFSNTPDNKVEFVIIPFSELISRLNARNRIVNSDREIEIVFWLMPDSSLYETTNIGAEGEWYFMSKGKGGRMADETEWDYTTFLNNWDQLLHINIG